MCIGKVLFVVMKSKQWNSYKCSFLDINSFIGDIFITRSLYPIPLLVIVCFRFKLLELPENRRIHAQSFVDDVVNIREV